MSEKYALVADQREWLVMHVACARALPTRGYWYAADVVEPTKDLRTDSCPWCRIKLCEPADPHLDQRAPSLAR